MMTPSPQLPPRLFVGREREMEDLLAGLEDACASRGRLLLLVGDPGIGKTRTAEELAVHARRRDALVLLGRCHESEGAPPYWPWVQLLRAYARASEPAALLADMGRGATDIAQVIEELRPRLPELPVQPGLEAEQARFRFFDSLTTFVKNAARRQPLVLILDDLHSADPPSLLLLQFLVREIADAAVLVLGTYRDVEVDRRHPLLEALGELAREPVSRVVPLRGLSQSDVARFMEVVGGSAAPSAMVATIYQRTEGNPFFVSELVRLLAPDGDWVRTSQVASSAIPLGVQEVVRARLDRLSGPCRRLLQIAAVAGREFDTRVIEGAAELAWRADESTPGIASQPLLAPLEEALQQRMIHEVTGALCTYAFSHALIRDALYAELSSTQRARLHRCVGESLETLAVVAPETRLAELAYHFFAGAAGAADGGKAAAYARRAGEYAQAALAYEEAGRCYDLALRALVRYGADERQQCELLLALGESHHQASNQSAARDAYRRGGDVARRLGEPELIARAALGFAGVVIGVEVDQQVLAVLEEGLSGLGQQDSGLRAMLLARLAMELYFSPDTERRAAVSEEAVATARRSGDTRALIQALEARHFSGWAHTGPVERLAITDEMIRLATATNSTDLLMHGHHLSVSALLELGRIEDVDAVIATYARRAEELRQPSFLWGLTMCRAMRALMDGRFDESEQLATAALALGQRVQAQTAANFFGAQIFLLRREQGRLGELEDALQAAAAAYPNVRVWRATLASLYAETGRRPAAKRELAHTAADDFHGITEDNNGLAALSMLAEASAFLGDAARAAVLYERLLPHAELIVVAGIASACSGAVARPLGLLAATLGRWDDAVRHFEHALAIHRRLRARPFVARTQLEYAETLMAAAGAGAREREESLRAARALVADSHATARALGMEGIAARGLSLMERLGLHPATQPETPHAVDSGSGSRASADVSDASENLFRQDGDHWVVAFGGQTLRFKDAKGLRYIALLLYQPNRPLHVTELLRAGASEEALFTVSDDSRDRLRDLLADLEEAERRNDLGRAERAQAEIDLLTHDLAQRLGFEPQTQPSGASSQLLRLRVTKAIKAAARKINTLHPALGHHLRTTIRTGSFCSYVPDPTKPIRWD